MRARPSSLPAVLLAGIATAAVLVQPSAAQAQTDVHDDARGDVVGIGEELGPVPEPDRADPDVQRVRVGHGAGSVSIRIRAAALDAGLVQLVEGRIRTPDGEADVSWVLRPNGTLRGRVLGTDGRPCAAEGRAAFDTAAGVVRVNVPRACLGDPQWVRVGAGLASFDHPDDFHLDDAGSDSLPGQWALGPRLRVG